MTDTTPQPAENSKSILITGAATGTGLSLTRELVKRGYKVIGTVKTPDEALQVRRAGALPSFPQLDRVNDVRGLMQMRRVTHVVHLAHLNAGGIPQYAVPESEYMTALRATDEIVAAAGMSGVQRMIFVSFAYLYGDTHHHAVAEDAPIQRNTPLLAALAEAENAVLDGGIPGYVLRSGYVYGAGTLALREVRDALQAGRGLATGSQPAAWLHEDDLASAILMLIEQGTDSELTGTVLNVAAETHMSPDKFVNLFASALGVGEPGGIPGFLLSRRTTPAQRDALEAGFLVSSQKIREMGWKPQFESPAAGIDRTLLTWRAATAPDAEPEQIPERAIVTL